MLILATRDGVILCERQGDNWQEVQRSLNGMRVTSAIARQGVILAGTPQGVFRSDDLGRSWLEANQGLTTRYVRWLVYHPQISDREFAGTEPAGIYVSYDGAGSWRSCPEVASLRDELGWSLPYSPEAGCVRGFVLNGQRGYAAVEVGGVLISDDGGESWQMAPGSQFPNSFPPRGSIHPDVHSLESHPSSPDLVYAPTGGGFYRSWDGAVSWELRYRSYCRAVWVDPRNPDHLILGPADGVDYNGRIEASHDGGITWEPASRGLQIPWSRHMVERFTQVGDELLGVLSNGDLVAANVETFEWRTILQDLGEINAVTEMA